MLLEADNMLRPIDWRWRRAKNLAARKGPPTKHDCDDDKWLHQGMLFLRNNDSYVKKQQKKGVATNRNISLNTRSVRKKIKNQWSAVAQAKIIYLSNTPVRWSLEALVVAGLSQEAIVNDIPCDGKKTIEAYEALFFDVRDRMDKSAFRLSLYPEIFTGGISKSQCDIYWKFIAYHMGPNVLRLLWHCGENNEEFLNQISDATLKIAALNGLQAVVTRDINRYTVHEAIEETPVMRRLLSGETQPDDADTKNLQQDLLESIEFSVLSAKTAPKASSEFRQGAHIKRLAEGKKSDTTETVDDSDEEVVDTATERNKRKKQIKQVQQRLANKNTRSNTESEDKKSENKKFEDKKDKPKAAVKKEKVNALKQKLKKKQENNKK